MLKKEIDAPKRDRCRNFTKEEELHLVKFYLKYSDIIECKSTYDQVLIKSNKVYNFIYFLLLML